MMLLGVAEGDDRADAEVLAAKAVKLRIFTDDADKMNLSLANVDGEILLVSQFTLYGDCSHGNRPSFITAARPETAIPLYEYMIKLLGEKTGKEIKTGEFGADMKVELLNNGPVTILMDTDQM